MCIRDRAHLPPAELGRVLSRSFRPLTEHTLADGKQLRACLEGVRREGYALSLIHI